MGAFGLFHTCRPKFVPCQLGGPWPGAISPWLGLSTVTLTKLPGGARIPSPTECMNWSTVEIRVGTELMGAVFKCFDMSGHGDDPSVPEWMSAQAFCVKISCVQYVSFNGPGSDHCLQCLAQLCLLNCVHNPAMSRCVGNVFLRLNILPKFKVFHFPSFLGVFLG